MSHSTGEDEQAMLEEEDEGMEDGGKVESKGEHEEEVVMSEVHLGCPPHFSGPYLSRFTFSIPANVKTDRLLTSYEDSPKAGGNPTAISLDGDGDLVLSRRKKTPINFVLIKHKITSSIPDVGLQVWKAAMVLADFVLHTCITSSDFHDVIALELGAGTGFAGLIIARAAKKVFLTDYDADVLDNCAENVSINSTLFGKNSVCVRMLNWKKSWPPTAELYKGSKTPDESRYCWTVSDIEEVEGSSVLLAADVLYSDELTDHLFGVLECLMSRGSEKVLYLSLEKRYNFTLDDLDVVANGYDHFRSFLKGTEGLAVEGTSPCFVGTRVDLDLIPQYFMQYDRGKDLEIWRITYSDPKNRNTGFM